MSVEWEDRYAQVPGLGVRKETDQLVVTVLQTVMMILRRAKVF